MREHRTIEAAGISVAERWVVAAKESDAIGQMVFGTVREGEGRATLDGFQPE